MNNRHETSNVTLSSVNQWIAHTQNESLNQYEKQTKDLIARLLRAVYDTDLTNPKLLALCHLAKNCDESLKDSLLSENFKKQIELLKDQVFLFIGCIRNLNNTNEILNEIYNHNINQNNSPIANTPLTSLIDGIDQFDRVNNVQYLDEKKREEFRIFAHDGKLKKINMLGKNDNRILTINHFDTSQHQVDEDKGKAIFVISAKGEIYAGSHIPFRTVYLQGTGEVYHPLSFYHSSFLSGKPVAFAGTIEVKDGELRYFDDESGHYQPNHLQNNFAVNYFQNLEIINKNTSYQGRSSNSSKKLLHDIRSDNQRIDFMIDQLIHQHNNMRDCIFLSDSKYKKAVLLKLIAELRNQQNIGKTVYEIIESFGRKASYRDKKGRHITNSEIIMENRCIFFSKDAQGSVTHELLKKLGNEHKNCKLTMGQSEN